MHDLRTLGGYASFATAINDSGTVVRWSYLADQYTRHAFVWTSSGGIQDLNSLIPSYSGWVLNFATAINASSEIVGNGTVNGFFHGLLLTPSAQK
jgi:probable HAF family extracellular repeat protein